MSLGVLDPDDPNAESFAFAVSPNGRYIVGVSSNKEDDPYQGVLFDGTGGVVSLASLVSETDREAYYFQSVYDVNDSGQIVVSAIRWSDFAWLAVRLDPVPPPK